MLSLSQYTKLQYAKANSLGIARSEMPQVFSKNLEEFKQFLNEKGIAFVEIQCSPRSLIASQNELNSDKVEKFLSCVLDPIITSKDKYVVDGHHRWAAALVRDKHTIDCLEIQLPIRELLDLMHTFDSVGYKTIQENK